MGLKSAASGTGIVGKFTGQPLTGVSVNFSGGSSPVVPANGYVLEDGTTNYVAEDNTTYYVQEGGTYLNEDASGFYILEDGSGNYILEA